MTELLPQDTSKDFCLRRWLSFRINNWKHLIQKTHSFNLTKKTLTNVTTYKSNPIKKKKKRFNFYNETKERINGLPHLQAKHKVEK